MHVKIERSLRGLGREHASYLMHHRDKYARSKNLFDVVPSCKFANGTIFKNKITIYHTIVSKNL